MAASYWIKLYHEILHDPKMCRLTDRLYRRTIELFLLAGETNEDGRLPPVGDIAWQFRMDEDELATDLADLASIGIVYMNGDRWIVTNFAKRQAPISDAERMRRYRERQKQQQYYGDETNCVTNPVTYRNTDTDIDTDTDKKANGELSLLSATFVNVTHIYEKMNDKWIGACKRMLEAGVTPGMIPNAVKFADENNYSISGPWSIEKIAINMARQKQKEYKPEEHASEVY